MISTRTSSRWSAELRPGHQRPLRRGTQTSTLGSSRKRNVFVFQDFIQRDQYVQVGHGNSNIVMYLFFKLFLGIFLVYSLESTYTSSLTIHCYLSWLLDPFT